MNGTVGSGNNAQRISPTSGWDTEDVMPDMDMEPPAGPAGPPVGPDQA
eukprot:CAMPEP_0119104594 /NCGR_PEP_ID=MMETSP1180-20130426/2776_1 /TAXON_ID=3052 ORGANISM="Chlamydomonas cf sp, Strain CCMP681" /NCGR_SAMPLE_ID=MMETSP1180 /ASSEMBLY_ACC=CAM_ASM_000741 /LENGTH=47 /DNA_ID= /DNA_START= /DNA_END= /DNA_ORIENTATION=